MKSSKEFILASLIADNGDPVQATVHEGWVHVGQPDGLDFSVVIFDDDCLLPSLP